MGEVTAEEVAIEGRREGMLESSQAGGPRKGDGVRDSEKGGRTDIPQKPLAKMKTFSKGCSLALIEGMNTGIRPCLSLAVKLCDLEQVTIPLPTCSVRETYFAALNCDCEEVCDHMVAEWTPAGEWPELC